jgi:DNA-binding CsgD family transcriptional regulator
MKWGYDFYSKTVHPKDISKLTDMYRIILQILCSRNEHTEILDEKQVSDISYFSFTLRIMEYPQMRDKPDYLPVHHKLIPIFIKDQIRFGLCRLTYSVISDSDNLRVYYKGIQDFDEYFSSVSKWKRQKTEQMSAQEIMILKYAHYGMNSKQIADTLSMEISTLDHAKTKLFNKLNVENLRQAVIYTTSHLMIFDPILIIPNTVKKRTTVKKRQYNKLTPEKLLCIQTGLDNGQFIRYIARKEKVSEASIRNAIKDGKLIKKDSTNI